MRQIRRGCKGIDKVFQQHFVLKRDRSQVEPVVPLLELLDENKKVGSHLLRKTDTNSPGSNLKDFRVFKAIIHNVSRETLNAEDEPKDKELGIVCFRVPKERGRNNFPK
jgi:hypothetical protein